MSGQLLGPYAGRGFEVVGPGEAPLPAARSCSGDRYIFCAASRPALPKRTAPLDFLVLYTCRPSPVGTLYCPARLEGNYPNYASTFRSTPRCACRMQIWHGTRTHQQHAVRQVMQSHRRLALRRSRGCRWGRSGRRCPCSRPAPGGGPTAAAACWGCPCRRRSAQASLCFWAKMSELYEGLELCVPALSC